MTHARTAGLETLSDWLRATVETREDALSHCLERISSLDPDIRAWAQVSPQTPTGGGPLLGIPFGAKDIMETQGLQTEFGSDVYRGRIGKADAAIVDELKSRGAVLMGKTHTTAFAYITPAPTRNPRALDHTPGGSSSGSAAAVAAGMVPLALGTQTKGSVLRPASFCGITGFKPTFGLFSMEGILPVAPSLDTLGFFTHTPDDMCGLWSALGRAPIDRAKVRFGLPDPLPDMDDAMREAIVAAVARLRRHGTVVGPVKLGDMLPKLAEAAHLVMFYEGARVHQARYAEHGDSLGDLADLVRAGLAISTSQYNEARQFIGDCGTRMADLYRTSPVILAPAATGPAPAGLASTGDPRLNAPWTALGTPAISVPLPVDGLPLGLQLTAARGNDGLVLGAAAQIWTTLRT